jgi:hypothetical protein
MACSFDRDADIYGIRALNSVGRARTDVLCEVGCLRERADRIAILGTALVTGVTSTVISN